MSKHPLMAPFMHRAGAMHPHPGPHVPHHAHGHHGHGHHGHGFCSTCCHPVAQCVCHRDCRKIEKELLVRPEIAAGRDGTTDPIGKVATPNLTREEVKFRTMAMMDLTAPVQIKEKGKKSTEARDEGSILRLRQQVSSQKVAVGMESMIIGGGCCVHLSIEYMPLSPLIDMPAFSGAMIMDSESTIMLWGKYFTGDEYHIKECVISTKPGAYLWVASINSVTRARWCEIVSC